MLFFLKSMAVNFIPLTLIITGMFVSSPLLAFLLLLAGNLLMLLPAEGPSYGSQIGRKLLKLNPTSHWK